MNSHQDPFAHTYTGWADYQKHLVAAVAPLAPDQLALSAAPHMRSAGELATHIAGVRAGWLWFVLGETDPRLAEFTEWSREDPPRTAAELARALETTWAVMADTILRYSPERLDEIVQDTDDDGNTWDLTRGWVVWHLLEHDLHHGGELGLTLGVHGIPSLEI
jgi:uncharacterized damage-inducible protein DinB